MLTPSGVEIIVHFVGQISSINLFGKTKGVQRFHASAPVGAFFNVCSG